MAQRIRVTHLLLAGGLVLAAGPAFAQEGMLFKNLMEGVIGGGGPPDIDYRERAPLVVPPNSTLPPPQAAGSARNAAWPTDPDVERRKNAKNVTPYVLTEKARNNPLLTQEELRKGRIATRGGPQQPHIAEGDHSNYENQIRPIIIGKEVAANRNQEAEDTLTYGREPERRMLTDPPLGYRLPAATAKLGPGQRGPVEDQQAVGQREFVTGQGPVMQP